MAAYVARYAHAFLDVVTSAKLDMAAVERQLGDFVATWEGSGELQAFLTNPAVTAPQKVAILDKLNEKLALQKEVRNLIAVLIDNDRISGVKDVVAAYRQALQARMGIQQAEIVTARELNAAEKESLLAGAGKLAGGKVEASFRLDRNILGGAVVRIGSTVYDGSVRGRLQRLRETLVAD